jgi:hypothetical protein
MYVHPDAKLIYLAHPRTASTSTGKALKEIGFINSPEGHHARLHEKRLLNKYGAPREKWLAFTTVRNHWCIGVSFIHVRRPDFVSPKVFKIEDFEKALDKCWYREDHEMYAHHKAADVFLRFEDVENQVNTILRLAGLGPIKLPHIFKEWQDKRGGPGYRRFYTDETRDYIYNRFKDEIERFGYEF